MSRKKDMSNIGYLRLGRGGNLILALLGFFTLIFALWNLVIDTSITYEANTSDYEKTFTTLESHGGTLVNLSETFKEKIVEDEKWQAQDYMIVGTGMINLILQLLLSVVPITIGSIAAIQSVLLNVGVPVYLTNFLIAGILFYVVFTIISMFRGKDY